MPGDFSDPLAENVGVSEAGLTFSRSRDYGSQILAHRGGGLNGDDALIDLPDVEPRPTGQTAATTAPIPKFLPSVHGFLKLCPLFRVTSSRRHP